MYEEGKAWMDRNTTPGYMENGTPGLMGNNNPEYIGKQDAWIYGN